MSAQSVSIAAMFGWVVDSFKLVGKNFRGLMSAGFITFVLSILMCIPMWSVMAFNMMGAMKNGGMTNTGVPMAGDMTMFYAVYAITVVISLCLFPPILVGWSRLCQNIDQNNAASGFDILKPYKDKKVWLRSIGFALLALLIYAAVFGVFALAFGGVISDFMQQMQAQQLAAMTGAAPAPPSFPLGFFLAYFGFLGVALFLQFIYMTGFAEISLRPTSVVDSMKMAASGVFKNTLQLILFVFCLFVAAMIFFMIFGLVLVMIVAALSFIHQALGMIVGGIFYIVFLLCIYPLMFAGQYFVWKSILGGNSPALPNAYDSTLPV
jgi:hypothetical protein